MKKLVAMALVLFALTGVAFAAPAKAASGKASASGTTPLTPYVDKGALLVNAGIGWGGLSGGAELTFARIDIGGVIPLTFGAAARAMIDPGIFFPGYTRFGVGAFGTAHFGLKGLNLPGGFSWASNCDTYIGIGLGLATASYSTLVDAPGFGFSTFEGVSYYLNDKLALNGEYGYLGRTKTYSVSNYYASVGVVFKL